MLCGDWVMGSFAKKGGKKTELWVIAKAPSWGSWTAIDIVWLFLEGCLFIPGKLLMAKQRNNSAPVCLLSSLMKMWNAYLQTHMWQSHKVEKVPCVVKTHKNWILEFSNELEGSSTKEFHPPENNYFINLKKTCDS